MLTKAAMFFAVAMLSGCALFHTKEQKIQVACTGVTAVTRTLTVYKANLSPAQIKRTVQLLDFLTPVCGYGSVPGSIDLDDVLDAKMLLMQIADYAASRDKK